MVATICGARAAIWSQLVSGSTARLGVVGFGALLGLGRRGLRGGRKIGNCSGASG